LSAPSAGVSGQHERELLAAVARREIVLRLQLRASAAPTDAGIRPPAGWPCSRCSLEVIHVADHDGKRPCGAPRRRSAARDVVEGAPVRDSGQRILLRDRLEALVGGGELGGESSSFWWHLVQALQRAILALSTAGLTGFTR